MGTKINCIYSDHGIWCKNKKIKRSVWGLGARICKEFPALNGVICEHKIKYQRPIGVPPLPPSNKLEKCPKTKK